MYVSYLQNSMTLRHPYDRQVDSQVSVLVAERCLHRSAFKMTPRGSSWRLTRAWPAWDSQPIHRLVSPCLGQSLKLQ